MKADQILSISKCGDLFPNDINKTKAQYKELAKVWHPDTNKSPKASDVFAKINELYNKALKLINEGVWEKTNYIIICKESGDKMAIDYYSTFDFELGTCYIANTKIIYLLSSDKRKYYDNAIKQVKSLKYKDRNMEEKFSMFFPKIDQTFKTNKGEYVISLTKTEDVYPLKDIFEYFDNKILDKHVAWILSRLCNLTCFMKFNNMVHNGISINNCFVSPKYHSILLLGGWWYATKENEMMIGTTKDIFDIMPVLTKSNRESSSLTDLESVKLLARQLLGESNCRKLALNTKIPKPFINYLICGSGSDSYDEFAKWDKALTESYGERKFLTMEIKNLYERKED